MLGYHNIKQLQFIVNIILIMYSVSQAMITIIIVNVFFNFVYIVLLEPIVMVMLCWFGLICYHTVIKCVYNG